MIPTPFEQLLVAFEIATPAERLRIMDWILNRSDDEADDEAGLDADEAAARAGITPEQVARFKRAVTEAIAYRAAQND